MRRYKIVEFVIWMVAICALAGCGGSSGSSATDPFAKSSASTDPGTGTIFGNISTATGKTGITLTADRTSVDVDNGQVLVTAKVVCNGLPVAGVPVTFNIVAPLNGPATIEAGRTTVTTDSNGVAITRITTGNTLSTTNVIVSATTTIGNKSTTANTTFQIVRGTGVIAVGDIPVKSFTIDPSVAAGVAFQQQIPVKLTDSNGYPRVGAPVTISVFTKSGTSSVAFSQPTVSTDSNGTAIFNATVTMTAPFPGLTTVDSIVFKLVTADANPVVAYAAGAYSVTSSTPTTTEPSMILTTDRTAYDVNDGSVMATAKIVKNGAPVSGASVTFSVVAPNNGPATIEAGLTTVTTDSNGMAVTRITTGSVSSTTNVIVSASSTVGSLTLNATATFQLVANLITQPNLTLTTDSAIYDNNGTVTATARIVKNGAAVTGKPVTYSVLSGGNIVTVGYYTPQTDRSGTSIATLTVSSNLKSTTNIIIQASVTIDGIEYIDYAQFQVKGYDPSVPPPPTVNITLTADKSQVDVNNGTVMLNANLIWGGDYLSTRTDGKQSVNLSGSYMANQPVTFTVHPEGGPATIVGSTLTTDSNGNAKAIFSAGNALLTTNIIVEASTDIREVDADGNPKIGTDGKPILDTFRAYTTIQIVRGGGVIMFTSAAGLEPGGQVNILTPVTEEVDSSLGLNWQYQQLIPFKVTDSNSNPRVGVPVTISVYSISTLNPDDVKVDFLVPPVTEATQQTITTDSAGQGIFNARINVGNPPAGGAITVAVVFKAVTNDPIPVTAYVGNTYTFKGKAPTAP